MHRNIAVLHKRGLVLQSGFTTTIRYFLLCSETLTVCAALSFEQWMRDSISPSAACWRWRPGSSHYRALYCDCFRWGIGTARAKSAALVLAASCERPNCGQAHDWLMGVTRPPANALVRLQREKKRMVLFHAYRYAFILNVIAAPSLFSSFLCPFYRPIYTAFQ